jgi:hypothetical protein
VNLRPGDRVVKIGMEGPTDVVPLRATGTVHPHTQDSRTRIGDVCVLTDEAYPTKDDPWRRWVSVERIWKRIDGNSGQSADQVVRGLTMPQAVEA